MCPLTVSILRVSLLFMQVMIFVINQTIIQPGLSWVNGHVVQTMHAIIMVQTLSGAILISYWRTWNLHFRRPKECSMMQQVVLWALLHCSSDLVQGWGKGVNRNGVQTYPLSPKSTPNVTQDYIALPAVDILLMSWICGYHAYYPATVQPHLWIIL